MPLKEFPCRYLGLPLHLRKLRRIDFLPLIEKVGAKLPRWKRKFMSKAARAQLMKSVLTAVVTYHTTVFDLPKWLIKKIYKLRRNFFLEGRGHSREQGWCLLSKMEHSLQAQGAMRPWHSQPQPFRKGPEAKMALVPLDR
jgi:hypothetical protein